MSLTISVPPWTTACNFIWSGFCGAGMWPGNKAAAQAALIDAALWHGYATKLEVVVAGCR